MSGKGKEPFNQPRLKGHERSASAYDGTTAGSGMSGATSPGTDSFDSSFFDSGHIDSGFQSEQFLSGEITSPSYSSQRSQELDSSDSIQSDSKSCPALDSGVVDIGLSGDLTNLKIDDNSVGRRNNLNAPHEYTEGLSSASLTSNTQSSLDVTTIVNPLSLPVDIYFEQDEDGDTQLHIAIYCKFIEVVYCLITMVPDPRYLDIRNDAWQTPLHFAVLTCQPRIVRRLVCAGASVDLLDMQGNTPLHLAVEQVDVASAAAILQPVTTAEAVAAQLKYSPALQRHVNINRHNYDGLACIHIAVMKRSIQLVQLLLWHGADINSREWKSGMTPLHLAVQLKDQQMIDLMVSQCKNLDLEEQTYAGLTAFQLAALQNSTTLAHYLLQKGADNCPIDEDSEEEDDDEEEVNNSYHTGLTQSKINGAINVSA
ncbi:NF-kappa-B inhibitor cactus isoform X2 [Nilaparvata lugens]|uniref:NF-kappa-B inhibitor cactus isoform X2 n=1 Tax=Nilaparvata lugens TaxID=108931 RepID=UPI000B989466|nr:NF-kappa-B inhibitor cactus isoform X2 [Nilaparvata lugens]